MARRIPAALLFALVAATFSSGCGSSTSTNVTSPSTARCHPALTPSATAYGPAGGTGTVAVSVSRECTWTASSQAPWITLTSVREGQGEGSIAYRIEANADPLARRGAVAVGDVRVELSQDAAPCRFQVGELPTPVPSEAGEHVIDVRTHAACSWTAASSAIWMGVSPSSGRGDGAVRVTFTANDGALRSGELTIAGERRAVTQQARALPPPPAPSPSPAPAPAPAPAPEPAPAPAPAPSPTPTPTPTPEPTAGPSIELEGRVSGLSGTCPTLTFRVDGQNVWTHSATKFKGGSCKAIKNGTEVEIEGRRMSDGRVRADEVDIDD